MVGGHALDTRRETLAAACEALSGLGAELWRAGSGDLEAVMALVDRVVVLAEAARVEVTGEAVRRGEPGSGAAAMTPVQWVRTHAPSTRSGGAAQVVAVAESFVAPGNAVVEDAVRSGMLPVRSAAVVVAEADRLRPLLAEGAEPAVLDGLVRMAVEHGPRGCRMLRPRLLATYGADGALQAEQDAGKRFVALSQPRVDTLGLAEYRLTLDVEGRAVLEAALGPLSAPKPLERERDLRSSDRRRGEALVTLVRRGVAASGPGPTSQKATLLVTVDHDILAASVSGLRPTGPPGRVRAGETVGGPEAGVLLAPETVRRLACDAAILPAVLGGRGEVVDLGRLQRLFTPGQIRRLWLRDQHCTYPGCDVPGQWCDAHHLIHWVDHGPTNLENAALLCERHHTVVHQRRLAGRVVLDRGGGPHVEWNLTHGSYDRDLAELRASGALPRAGFAGREPA